MLSEPCCDLDAYRANFVAAERVLQLFSQVPEGPAVVRLETARALTLLFREGGEPQLDRFAADVLRPILE